MKLRKLVNNYWVHVSPGVVSGSRGRVGGLRNYICLFGWIVDHQNKKFFVNNSVEVLILFNEGHQGSIETTCTFTMREGVSVCGGSGGGQWEMEGV